MLNLLKGKSVNRIYIYTVFKENLITKVVKFTIILLQILGFQRPGFQGEDN